MSEPRDITTDADALPQGLIVLGAPDGDTDAGECADGFCAL
ncbi:hypothetical protein [Jiangella endophytica]|nr:hypothetical protein [Jiangella endophytica]